MRAKFLGDVNLNRRIVEGILRRKSLADFQLAEEPELSGKSDLEVLETAASLQRILVTHDRKTMPNAFGKFVERRESSGLLIIPQKMGLRAAIEELLLIWAASEAEEWINQMATLPL